MKLLGVLSILLLIGVVAAQDSVILPGWETREPGYELRVIGLGEDDGTGPYHPIDPQDYEERTAELGVSCVLYEKLVWRKQHATLADVSLFNRQTEHLYALLDQFNPPTMTTTRLTGLTFEALNPVILGRWTFVSGEILEGDTKDTLYFVYQACRAL